MQNNKITLCLLCASLVLLAFSTAPSLHASGQSGGGYFRNYLPMLVGPDLPRWVGPDGGSIVSMAVDPKNGNVVYAGSWGGGVYKSTDGGAHWYSANNGITNLLIHNLAIDPKNTNRIYAGTYRGGVFRSEDGGKTWVHASSGMQGLPIVYGLAVNNGYPNMVYAGTRDGLIDNGCSCPPWGGVLYKSWDYGNTWTPVLYNVAGPGVQDWVYAIAVDPINYNNVLAATHEHGIYWTNAYGGSLSEWHSTSGIADYSTRALAFDPKGINVLTGTFDHDAVYRSLDEGQHWKLSNNGLKDVRIFPNGLSAATSSPGVVYAASMSDPWAGIRGVFRTDNGGASWNKVGLDGENLYTVRASTTNGSVVYAGAQDDGLFKSTNSGSSWSLSISGIANNNITGIVRPYGDMIMVSTYGKGVFFTFDYGRTWLTINSGLGDLNVNGLFIEPHNPFWVYALTERAGLKKLDLQTSITWSAPLKQGKQPIIEGMWKSEQVFKATGQPVNLPVGKQNPFKLVDPANEFTPLKEQAAAPGGSLTSVLPANAPILSMASAPTDSRVMYVGTNGSGVFVTTDGGVHWSQTMGAIGGMVVRGLAVDQNNAAAAYAVTDHNNVVMSTADGGVSWVSYALPALPSTQNLNFAMYAIATAKDVLGRNVIYVGTSSGLWILAPNEPRWYELGLFNYGVTSIAPSPTLIGALFAGTTNGAYYSSTLGQWNPVSTETYGHMIQTITFDPDMKHVYFGANSHGMFILPWAP